MTVIRKLVTLLGFEVDKSSLSAAEGQVNALKTGLKGLAAGFAAVGLKSMMDDVVGYAYEIHLANQNTGIAIDQLEGLAEAADNSEVSLGTLTSALTRMTMQGHTDPLKDILETAEAMEKVDPSKGTELAFDRLGRGAMALMPMLKMGRAEIEATMADAKKSGAAIGEAGIASAVEYKKALREFGDTLEGLQRSIFTPFIASVAKILRPMKAWVETNREMIRTKITEFLRITADMLGLVLRAGQQLVKVYGWVAEKFGGTATAIALVVAGLKLMKDSAIGGAMKFLGLAALIAGTVEEIEYLYSGADKKGSLFWNLAESVDALWKKLSEDHGWNEKHPALAFLLTMLKTITSLRDTFDEWQKLVMNSWLGKGVIALGDRVKKAGTGKSVQAMDPETGLPLLDSASVDMLANYLTAQRQGKTAERPAWQQGFDGTARRIGVAAFNPSLAPAPVSPVTSLNAPINVTVNAQTNAAPDQIGDAIVDRIQDFVQTQYRQALAHAAAPE